MGDKLPLNSPVSTSQTGIITVNRPLDREQIPEYRLTISVKDNPENPRIARRVRLQGIGWGRGLQEGRNSLCVSGLFHSMEMVPNKVYGLFHQLRRSRKSHLPAFVTLEAACNLVELYWL